MIEFSVATSDTLGGAVVGKLLCLCATFEGALQLERQRSQNFFDPLVPTRGSAGP